MRQPLFYFTCESTQQKRADKPRWTHFRIVSTGRENLFSSHNTFFIAPNFSAHFNNGSRKFFLLLPQYGMLEEIMARVLTHSMAMSRWWSVERARAKSHSSKIIFFLYIHNKHVHEEKVLLFFFCVSFDLPRKKSSCFMSDRKVSILSCPTLLLPRSLSLWEMENRFHLTNNIWFILNKLCCFSTSPPNKVSPVRGREQRDHDKLCVYKHEYGCQIRLKF